MATLKYTLQCFGVSREICGGDTVELQLEEGVTVRQLHEQLRTTYPALGELRHFFIARNQEYAQDDDRLEPTDELVIIPPVSGG